MLWFAQKLVPLRYHQQHDGKVCYLRLVVICSKISTFAVSSTTLWVSKKPLPLLWFAQKLVPLRYHQQPLQVHWMQQYVVICSKISTFAVSSTTGKEEVSHTSLLWFAQKLVPLRYHQQHATSHTLSISVVICSKISTFAVSSTTKPCVPGWMLLLWFAQKLVPLRYHQQRMMIGKDTAACCDLLKN